QQPAARHGSALRVRGPPGARHLALRFAHRAAYLELRYTFCLVSRLRRQRSIGAYPTVVTRVQPSVLPASPPPPPIRIRLSAPPTAPPPATAPRSSLRCSTRNSTEVTVISSRLMKKKLWCPRSSSSVVISINDRPTSAITIMKTAASSMPNHFHSTRRPPPPSSATGSTKINATASTATISWPTTIVMITPISRNAPSTSRVITSSRPVTTRSPVPRSRYAASSAPSAHPSIGSSGCIMSYM